LAQEVVLVVTQPTKPQQPHFVTVEMVNHQACRGAPTPSPAMAELADKRIGATMPAVSAEAAESPLSLQAGRVLALVELRQLVELADKAQLRLVLPDLLELLATATPSQELQQPTAAAVAAAVTTRPVVQVDLAAVALEATAALSVFLEPPTLVVAVAPVAPAVPRVELAVLVLSFFVMRMFPPSPLNPHRSQSQPVNHTRSR
jgi:hypothetical protein